MYSFRFEMLLSIFLLAISIAESELSQSAAPKLIQLHREHVFDESQTASIVCSLISGDTESLSYEWLKNDVALKLNPSKVKVTLDSNNEDSRIKIFNVSEVDAGVYSCIAKNKFGKDRVSTSLNVRGSLARLFVEAYDTGANINEIFDFSAARLG